MFAMNGITKCIREGSNFRIQVFIALVAAVTGILFGISHYEWMLVLLCTGLVLGMEMINTAIEQLCNVVHKEFHPGIKITKDVAAGAVLLSSLIALICGLVIFVPKIISLMN